MLTKIVETERGPVEYSEAGAGDPVLYFHGTGVTGDVMLTVEMPMVGDDFRMIAPNRPGYGSTPLSPHESAAGCADLAAALLSALGIAKASVMGSSGGASFAVSFAIRHASRARSLVLLCPQLHRWDHKRWLPKTSRWTLPLLTRPLLRRLLIKLYGIQLRHMSVAQFLKMEAGDRYPDVACDPVAQALCKTTLAAAGQCTKYSGFENDFLVFTSEEIFGSKDSLRVPTLVIHDVKDPLAPVEHIEWFVSRFPQCETAALHAAGHLIWAGPDALEMHQLRVRFMRNHAATGA